MKKILAVIAAVVLVATLSFGAVMLTSADVSPLKITVSSETATKGESKDITIAFSNNELGVSSTKIEVSFPSDLILEDVVFNEDLEAKDPNNKKAPEPMIDYPDPGATSPISINWVNLSRNRTGDLLFATLTFKVADDATLGDKDISITYNEGDIFYYSSGTYADKNLQTTLITPDIVNGKITVVNCLHTNTTDYPAVASTCTVAGHKAYTKCNDCEAIISGDATPLALAAHTEGTATRENEIPATCTVDGSYDEVVKCTACGTEMSRTPKTITAPGHTAGAATRENEIPATCTAAGSYDEVVKCTVCGTEISRTPKEIKKLDHTAGAATRENEIPATCTVDGSYDEVVKCTACGTEMSRTPKTITAPGHTAGTPVKEKVVAADCTTGGTYDEVVYCTVCQAEMSRTPKTTDALGHTEADEWSSDSSTHWKECTACDEKAVEPTAHTFEYKVTKEATATEDGLKEEMCTVCGYKTGNKEAIKNYTDTTAAETKYDAKTADQDANKGAVAIPTKMTMANFSGVVINGVTLTKDDYDVEEDGEGNAKVTIKPAYLAKLANGNYIIKVVGTDGGEATSTLTVSGSTVGATPAATGNTTTTPSTTTTTSATTTTTTGGSPKTADNDIAFLIIALLAVMGSSIFAGVTYRRKRNSK